MSYVLHVKFKSNEHPWDGNYEPMHQPEDDVAALRWAYGMASGMDMYQCTLMKDGKVLSNLRNDEIMKRMGE